MRRKFFYWLVYDLLKIDQAVMLPKFLVVLHYILFPFMTIACKSNNINYDPGRDIFIIFGIKYSAFLFHEFSKNGMRINTHFKIVKRKDETLIIETIIEK